MGEPMRARMETELKKGDRRAKRGSPPSRRPSRTWRTPGGQATWLGVFSASAVGSRGGAWCAPLSPFGQGEEPDISHSRSPLVDELPAGAATATEKRSRPSFRSFPLVLLFKTGAERQPSAWSG